MFVLLSPAVAQEFGLSQAGSASSSKQPQQASSTVHILSLLLRLRQSCCHLSLLKKVMNRTSCWETHTPCRTHKLTVRFFTSAPPADPGLLWAKWRWDCPVSGGATQCSVPHFQPITVWSRLQRYRGPEWDPVPFTALWGEQWEHKGGELPSPHPNTQSFLPQGHLKCYLTNLHFSRFLQLSPNLRWSERRILTRKGRTSIKSLAIKWWKLFWSSYLKQVIQLKNHQQFHNKPWCLW